MSLLKCVPPSEAEYITREIHEDICGNHARGIPSVQNLKTRLLLANDEVGLYGVHPKV